METRSVQTIEELKVLAHEVLEFCIAEGLHHIFLSGDLGAGKTAFVKALGALLQIKEDITSPTFVVMKSYEIPPSAPFTKLTHIDAYRIESDDEMRVLGFEEIMGETSRLVCIEWPERIAGVLPSRACAVEITITSTGARSITYGIKN